MSSAFGACQERPWLAPEIYNRSRCINYPNLWLNAELWVCLWCAYTWNHSKHEKRKYVVSMLLSMTSNEILIRARRDDEHFTTAANWIPHFRIQFAQFTWSSSIRINKWKSKRPFRNFPTKKNCNPLCVQNSQHSFHLFSFQDRRKWTHGSGSTRAGKANTETANAATEIVTERDRRCAAAAIVRSSQEGRKEPVIASFSELMIAF